MASKQPSQRQLEIKRLLEADQSVGEIAKVLGTSAQAVHTQISRMRKDGILPKAKRGRSTATPANGRRRRALPSAAQIEGDESLPAAPLGPALAVENSTVEDHVNADLAKAKDRLLAISEEKVRLDTEEKELEDRRNRLEQASSALTATAVAAE